MKFAVLLVSVADKPRVTTLTRAWVERACASVKRYFEDQSGGRVSPVFQVFDWYALSMTFAQWMALGGNVSAAVNAEISAAQQIDFSGFDRFIYIQDSGMSNTGVSENDETRIEARDFDPALLAHELGHVYGPDDSFLDTPTGPARYDDLFCVMGREGNKYSFRDPALISPAEGADASHADCGPGMCVPSLLATGWLEIGKHAVQVTGYTNAAPGSSLRIRALDGAPAKNSVGLPSFCYVDDGDRYFVEYRVPRSRWDSGLPPSLLGWVVVHRTVLDEPLMTLQVAAFQASPGQTLTIGGPSNIYIFGGGPLRITVLGCDPATGSIDLELLSRVGKAAAGTSSPSRASGRSRAPCYGLPWPDGAHFRPKAHTLSRWRNCRNSSTRKKLPAARSCGTNRCLRLRAGVSSTNCASRSKRSRLPDLKTRPPTYLAWHRRCLWLSKSRYEGESAVPSENNGGQATPLLDRHLKA